MSGIDFFICRADVGLYKPNQCEKARIYGLSNLCGNTCIKCSKRPYVYFVAVFSLKYHPGQYVLRGKTDKKTDFPLNTVLDRVFSHVNSEVLFVSGVKKKTDHILKVLGFIKNPAEIKGRKILKREEFVFDRVNLSVHLL